MDDSLACSPSPTLFSATTMAPPKSNRSSSRTASPPTRTSPNTASPSTASVPGGDTSPVAPTQQQTHNTSRHGRRGRRRKVLGLRTAHTNQQKANDPFDYEQKYAEDEEFKEMGPMARVWRVFLDECGAFDAEMVEDWRDALDVLLVFAGLFSAVVTTFVAQTSQKLEIDFTEVNAHLLFESLAIERAKAAGSSILEIPASKLTPFTPFRPSRMAVWVNGLWFTSLALSLTTALMAVLTKQWIHQYLSVPSGTPQDRCRIRQFRFMSLENWHVPVIIGLLPVLMHVALGIFLAGLVVFLCSFNTSMAGAVGSIAVTALVIYFATNLLPIFKPDCPYKTPLTLHCHDFSAFAWPRIKTLLRLCSDGTSPKEHMSLKVAERDRVKKDGGNMDVQCLSWLYNMSSNSSVQRVVLQALSNIPLKEAKAIHKLLPALSDHIRSTLVDYITPDRRFAWERLFRALNRFDDWMQLPPDEEQQNPIPNSVSNLFHDGLMYEAIDFLRGQIVEPTVDLDVLSWTRILRNALWGGTQWLDIDNNDSKVWTAFRDWFLDAHICHTTVHERNDVWEVYLTCDKSLGWKDVDRMLYIFESNGSYDPYKTTSDGTNLRHCVQSFLYPSICHFLSSNVLDDDLDIPPTLPGEIRIHLSLLRSSSILQTSAPYNPETDERAALGKLIHIMRVYVDIEPERGGWQGGALAHHPELTSAIFMAFYSILESDFFEPIELQDRQELLHPLLRTMVVDGKLREQYDISWMPTFIVERIITTTFPNPTTFFAPVVNEILDYYLFCHCALGEKVYALLLEADWAVVAERESVEGPPGHPTDATRYRQRFTYPFLISSYIDGLEFLQKDCPVLYQQSLEYISQPTHLLTISKILVLGDVDSRTRMWKLASLVKRNVWTTVLGDLEVYLVSEDASSRHEEQLKWLRENQPYRFSVQPKWEEFEELGGFVAQFRDVIRQDRVMLPVVTPVYSRPKQLEDFLILK